MFLFFRVKRRYLITMTLMTSTHFASASATGTDWRDTSRKVLEQFESVRTPDDHFTLGFLYITDTLAADAGSILTLFKSVTGIEHWVGASGLGVIASGQEFVDQPAISAMIARFEAGSFRVIKALHTDQSEIKKELKPWMDRHEPMLTLLHGDPASSNHPEWAIGKISEMIGGFIAGGLTSSRNVHAHIADGVLTEGFSGVTFESGVAVSAALSQGCEIVGKTHTITRADDHIILEIDGRKPDDVFTDTLQELVRHKTGKDPESVLVEGTMIPPEFQHLFRGDMHVAFPVEGSDTGDFMVRNIVGIAPEDGYMAVTHRCKAGDRVMFVHRDDDSTRTDLSRTLVTLRKRVQAQNGIFAPKGAIYISCVARAMAEFSPGIKGGEMALVREIIGDIPLTGFYAGGEISAGRLYGYTAVLILFL